jgi:hypothetical protein
LYPPFTVQQNSVYPSQQREPQPQSLLPHLQIAAYAVPGFRRKSTPPTVAALPRNAERTKTLRRDILASSTPATRSMRVLLSEPM